MGRSQGHFGDSWGLLGRSWGDLKSILATLGPSCGASWANIGASWGFLSLLQVSWRPRAPKNIFPLGSPGPLGPPFWDDFCAVLDALSMITPSCLETPQSKETTIFIVPETLDRTSMTRRIHEFAGLSSRLKTISTRRIFRHVLWSRRRPDSSPVMGLRVSPPG